jgi:hypothetical protein
MPLLTSQIKSKPTIVSEDALVEKDQPIEFVKPYANDYQPVYVDLRWIPENALLTHIEGAAWVVDYYSQVITKDSDLSGQQLTASGVYQQYTAINGMEMRVITPLTPNQDEVTKSMTAEGEAGVYPFLIPNVGDMFLAEVEPNVLGLFRVTGSTKKSIFNQACFSITYGLDTTDRTKINNLRSKAVKTYYYHKDYLGYGKNPLLITTDAQALTDLARLYPMVLDHYMNSYLSVEYNTFILPKQTYDIHDPWLTAFILDNVTTDEHPNIRRVRQLNTHGDIYMRVASFWKAISDREVAKMNIAFSKFSLVSRVMFEKIPALAGYRYSGFGYVIYPENGDVNVDANNSLRRKLTASDMSMNGSWLTDDSPLWRAYSSTITSTMPLSVDTVDFEELDPTLLYDPYAWEERPLLDRYAAVQTDNLTATTKYYQLVIPNVSTAGWYVFSENFHKGHGEVTVFESMVMNYIKRHKVDPKQLADLCKLYHAWGELEKFYYVPIMLVMIKAAMRGF